MLSSFFYTILLHIELNIMKTSKLTVIAILLFSILCSCNNSSKFDAKKNEAQIRNTLNTLLTAIENRNIDALTSTMSPSGKMELILPNTEITYSVDEFVNLHKKWFKDTTWTIQTKILSIKPGQYIGTATTEAIYREPNRNGKPYLNHIIVSYVLEKGNDNVWYVIKDHASSLKKTTN